MAPSSFAMRVVLMVAFCFASAAAQSVRGAEKAAEYPMQEVPTNQNSDLAIASMVSAIVVPFVALVIMMWLKEKAWWGACYLIGGMITLLWVYCAYIAL
mmetsp:Transcript_91654/g.263765  ORF Transcript_91654/g.263765 Transcript_91654/m.263765 type:complete len:99 (-) Transcript_91654:149-445(-)